MALKDALEVLGKGLVTLPEYYQNMDTQRLRNQILQSENERSINEDLQKQLEIEKAQRDEQAALKAIEEMQANIKASELPSSIPMKISSDMLNVNVPEQIPMTANSKQFDIGSPYTKPIQSPIVYPDRTNAGEMSPAVFKDDYRRLIGKEPTEMFRTEGLEALGGLPLVTSQSKAAKSYMDAFPLPKEKAELTPYQLAMLAEQEKNRKLKASEGAANRAQKNDEGKKDEGEKEKKKKPLESEQLTKLTQLRNTAYSIGKMQEPINTIASGKRGPISGYLFSKNPYDAELKSLENLVNQIVPSMARGVFGEVGVLTDQDADRYKAMLPSAKQDPSVAKKIYNEIRDKIDSAWKLTISSFEDAGRDVSGYKKYNSVWDASKSNAPIGKSRLGD